VLYIFKILDFHDYKAQISLRDPENPGKYLGAQEQWDAAEQAIIEAAQEKGLRTIKELGEAAFYGPKLDFMVRDALQREWQLGTVQLDYQLPERFQLEYIGADNERHRPVMIHRAPFGSLERFVAVLLEHTGGDFPLWLAPVQVMVLPIAEKFNDQAWELTLELRAAGFRADMDERHEKIGKKIRDAETGKLPYMLVLGEQELAEGAVAVRKRKQGDLGRMSRAAFTDFLRQELERSLEGAPA
jgi:threonyl-tRNA synthetase